MHTPLEHLTAPANRHTAPSSVCEYCNCKVNTLPAVEPSRESVPFVLLHGSWLRDAGLEVGTRVIVEAALGVVTVALIGPAGHVERVMPDGPDGLIRHFHFTNVHADPLRKIPSAA